MKVCPDICSESRQTSPMRRWPCRRLISSTDFIMLLQLTHTTGLTYSDMINESIMELRMASRQEQDQHRLSFKLSIGPAASVTSYFDWLGNTVHTFTIS